MTAARGARDRQADPRLGPRRRHRRLRAGPPRRGSPLLAPRQGRHPSPFGRACLRREAHRRAARGVQAAAAVRSGRPASASSATARPVPGSRRELPRASRSSASSAAPRSPGSTPAPTSSASRAPPTPSARSSSRPEPPACRPSRSRRAAPAELVGHGQTGLLVPPDDPRAFAAALGRLVGDPALRQSLGEGALAVAGRRTWERSFAELRDAYRIAVHGTPSELRTRIAA